MARFKRNQLEQAIARVLGPHSARPNSELRTRLKRLLETDRSLGRTQRSADPGHANYAFYSSDSPGRGVEVWFSQYEACALLTGLRLLAHGWPQGFVVAILRRVRPEFEREHARILKQEPAALFDAQLIRQKAQPGNLAVDNADPVFLTIGSGETQAKDVPLCAICRGQDGAMTFMKRQGVQSVTIFELASVAHKLSGELAKAAPRKRGRSG
jgi:hypothetical protein